MLTAFALPLCRDMWLVALVFNNVAFKPYQILLIGRLALKGPYPEHEKIVDA